jgi:hypothetical protein
MIPSVLLSSIFIILGAIHFNWVIGGKFGFEASLPTKENGERVLNPKKYDSAIVGLGLSAFGVFYLITSGLVNYHLPDWILNYGGWVIPVIFLLRGVGEFKYVGIFKSVKETNFGKLDTKVYSPLCLAIGVLGIIIQLMR